MPDETEKYTIAMSVFPTLPINYLVAFPGAVLNNTSQPVSTPEPHHYEWSATDIQGMDVMAILGILTRYRDGGKHILLVYGSEGDWTGIYPNVVDWQPSWRETAIDYEVARLQKMVDEDALSNYLRYDKPKDNGLASPLLIEASSGEAWLVVGQSISTPDYYATNAQPEYLYKFVPKGEENSNGR